MHHLLSFIPFLLYIDFWLIWMHRCRNLFLYEKYCEQSCTDKYVCMYRCIIGRYWDKMKIMSIVLLTTYLFGSTKTQVLVRCVKICFLSDPNKKNKCWSQSDVIWTERSIQFYYNINRTKTCVKQKDSYSKSQYPIKRN